MKKQLIISVGREFGSGGHVIAETLAKRFDLPLYDSNILESIAQERNVDAKTLHRYDEVPRNILFSRRVRKISTSAEENIAQMQFEYLKKKADEGESFVVVGRCSETKLTEPGIDHEFSCAGRYSGQDCTYYEASQPDGERSEEYDRKAGSPA